MSASRINVPFIRAQKNTAPLVCLTAYTAPFAEILDKYADILLVGDSLGMVLYGMDSTLSVTLEMMIAHGKAVARKTTHALVVVDMPFGSYQESPEQAFRNAARVMAETGCHAVKLEGGKALAETIAFLSARGIPVMAHIGMMPQSVHYYGGFRVQGKEKSAQNLILSDAHAVEDAGAFAVVLESIPKNLAEKITKALGIPTIGIGASPKCDGQILVAEDMSGLTRGASPKFVRRFGALAEALEQSAKAYQKAVLARSFPGEKECYR